MDVGDGIEVVAHEDELIIILNPDEENEIRVELPQWVMDEVIARAGAVRNYGRTVNRKQSQ